MPKRRKSSGPPRVHNYNCENDKELAFSLGTFKKFHPGEYKVLVIGQDPLFVIRAADGKRYWVEAQKFSDIEEICNAPRGRVR